MKKKFPLKELKLTIPEIHELISTLRDQKQHYEKLSHNARDLEVKLTEKLRTALDPPTHYKK